jgi:hypothetical protein
MCPRARVLRPRSRVRATLEAACCSPTSPRLLAPSAKLSHPLSFPTHVTRQAPSRLTGERRPFCDRRRARPPSVASVSSASSSATWDTPRFALFIFVLPSPRSPEHFLRSRSPPPSTQDFSASLPFSRRSEFTIVASNLPMPLIRLLLSLCLRNSSPELIYAAVSPPRRVPRSLVPCTGVVPTVEFAMLP